MQTPIDHAGDEYGNYKKFEDGRNSVKEVVDEGREDRGGDMFSKNLESMMRNLENPF